MPSPRPGGRESCRRDRECASAPRYQERSRCRRREPASLIRPSFSYPDAVRVLVVPAGGRALGPALGEGAAYLAFPLRVLVGVGDFPVESRAVLVLGPD